MTTAETRAGSAGGTALQALDGAWARDVRWWDLACYLIVALTGVAVLTGGVRGTPLAVALGAVGVLLVAYAVLGRRAARTREQGLAVAYLTVVTVCTVVVVAQTTLGTFLLFVAFTQVWMLSERVATSIAFCVAIAAGTAYAMAWGAGPRDGPGVDAAVLAEVAPQMGVSLVFAVGLGVWVAHTLRQSERHARLVDELHATQAALAVSHHAAGVAAERERVAREIHDTLAQGFTSVVMLAQAARADLERDAADDARERLALVEATARDNLAEARALVAASAPAPLQGGTLTQALARLVDRFQDEADVRVAATVADVGGLSSAHEVVLLRSAQEALANVRRHAAARRVTLRLGVEPDAGHGVVALDVVDDGRGLGPAVTEGFGLRGMRERVTASGGALLLEPAPGGGTAVRVRLPFPREAAP